MISSLIKFFFLPKVNRCNCSIFLNLLFNGFSLTESLKKKAGQAFCLKLVTIFGFSIDIVPYILFFIFQITFRSIVVEPSQ